MFELIGALIYMIWKATWFCLKMLVKLSPLYIVLIAYFGGMELGDTWFIEGIAEDYEYEIVSGYSHEVTVYWDDDRASSDTFYVREDINWTLDYSRLNYDYVGDLPLYDRYDPGRNYLPDKAEREGYKFLGLFSSPYGAEQYVDANGYSLKTIKSDVELYAMWEKVA